MKLSICPTCRTKFKTYKNNYCSWFCYKKINRAKKVLTVKKESLLWKEYWNIKLYNAPLEKLTTQDYEDYDVIFKYDTFINNKS